MLTEKGKATVHETMAKPTHKAYLLASTSYQTCSDKSSQKSIDRQAKIAERRAQMPRSCRATYDKAVRGKGLRAAINAFCMECVCWQIDEVRNCTDLACPLYAVRPYQRSSQNGHSGDSTSAESTNARQ